MDDSTAAPQLEILTASWADIKPHAERAAVFVIHGDQNLADVAQKVIDNDVEAVSRWIDQGAIARPTPAQIEIWDKVPRRLFRFAIVQPYVLIQELAH